MNKLEFSGLSKIGQIAVMVQYLDRAVEFYRDKLGLKFLFQVPGMAFFDCGGVRLMLSRPEGTENNGGSSILYFKIADIKASFDDLKKSGVEFKVEPHLVARMPDHDLWMAFFSDSEGNTMALMSEVRQVET